MAEHVTIPRTRHYAFGPLTWALIKGSATGEPDTAFVTCPEGHIARLEIEKDGKGHTIANAGQVTPSLVCPNNGCDFHVWARLEGWADRNV